MQLSAGPRIGKLFKMFFIVLLASTYCWGQSAELKPGMEEIMPLMRLQACPTSGKINLNAPWFYWSPVISSRSGNNTYEFDDGYMYKGRLSQNLAFDGTSTITSDAREWCFFNPHQKLSKGVWYWQYATITKIDGKEKWSEPVRVEVTGEERDFVIPSFEELKNRISKDHPRVLCSANEIGKLNFPKNETDSFLKKVEGLKGQKFPETLLYSDHKVIEKKKSELTPADLRLFIAKRTKEIYRGYRRDFEQLLKAYLITGDTEYLEEGVRWYYYLKSQYEFIIESGYYNDFTEGFFLSAATLLFDVGHDYIPVGERTYILNMLEEFQTKSYHHILHRGEHFALDSHLWQHHFRGFFITSLALLHHTPKAEKWLKYVYEVWSMRAPVGSRNDGGWAPGNGYLDANKESLITMPMILSRLTGVNYFEHPWYSNVAGYLAYTAPVGHVAGSFGDNADIKHENCMDFVRAITNITHDPYGQMYSDLGIKLGHPQDRGIREPKDEESRLPMSLYEDGNLYWYMYQPVSFHKKKQKKITAPERAKCFRDIGVVAMHSNLLEPDKNLMVAFRSSPYGVTGHAHACQNSFNIQYMGEPLFFRTGYYSSFIDPHSVSSYRHTRAHNTILADGIGQTFTPSSYGWIARFLNGHRISYALGDASSSYNGTLFRDLYIKRFKKWKIEPGAKNGFGTPGVKRFRRHITMLENKFIVIYDELEAEKPVNWSWMIHSRDTLACVQNTFYTENNKGKGKCWVYGGELKSSVTNQFFSPAVDWLGNGSKRGIEYVDHWHGETSTARQEKQRFLAIIQVVPDGDSFMQPLVVQKGHITIDGWDIKAELDGLKPAILVLKKEQTGAISYGTGKIEFDGNTYLHKVPGSTLLIEKRKNKTNVQEDVDKLPDAAVYF